MFKWFFSFIFLWQNQIIITVQPIELVCGSSGRPTSELPQSLQPPASVRATARYRLANCCVRQTDIYSRPCQLSLTAALVLLFTQDACTVNRRALNRRAAEASRQLVTLQILLPRTLQVREVCVAVTIIWGGTWKNAWFTDFTDALSCTVIFNFCITPCYPTLTCKWHPVTPHSFSEMWRRAFLSSAKNMLDWFGPAKRDECYLFARLIHWLCSKHSGNSCISS